MSWGQPPGPPGGAPGGGWGPPGPQGQGQPGWGPAPAPPGYAPPIGAPNPAAKIEKDAQGYLIAAVLGFFLGFSFITGPLAWWKGNELAKEAASMGIQAPANVGHAKIAGIVTTVLTALGILALIGIFVFAAIFFHGVG